MKRSMISSLALTAAMLISSAAWAQTMVGQQSVSAEDLPEVQAQCNTLAAEAKESLGSQTMDNEDADDASGGDNNSGDNDASSTEDNGAGDLSEQSEVPNGADQAVTTVDLSLITLEDCKAAGLVQ